MGTSVRTIDVLRERHPRSLFGPVVGIALLSQLDAALTLTLLQTGEVIEANPLMSFVLDQDTRLFVALKGFVTGASLVFLVASLTLAPPRRVSITRTIQGLLLLYVLVIAHELAMLSALT